MYRGCRTLSGAAVVTVLVLAPAVVTANVSAKMDWALREVASRESPIAPVDVIVQTRSTPSQAQEAGFRALGGRYERGFAAIKGFAGSVPAGNLAKLAALPWVERISSDASCRKMLDVAAAAVGAPAAWNGLGCTGEGVAVAVIDSGVASHLDFSRSTTWWLQRVIGGYDWVEGSDRIFHNDRCGHGTSVAGVIAGNGRLSTNIDPDAPRYGRTFTGIAPKASIVNCRVLDAEGVGRTSDVISAIEWCVARAGRLNIRVINLSLGHPIQESYRTDPLCRACEYAWLNGITVVVAAGNLGAAGYSTILSPANDPYVIAVGAINTKGTPQLDDDQLCGYSSRGPSLIDHIVKPDLVAPGNRIVAARSWDSLLERDFRETNLVPLDYYVLAPRRWQRPAYFVFSGTSMSAGVVSGACALMVERDPSLTPDTIKTRLMLTALKSPSYGPLWQGAGYVSVADALRSRFVAATPAKSPEARPDPGGGTVHPAPVCPHTDGNIIWEPLPPAPPPENVLVYGAEPAHEVYQPGKDLGWDCCRALAAGPESVCRADLSEFAIFGEDQPIYLGTHGPLPIAP